MPLGCNSLWIGSALGRVERACLRSFLRVGHAVTLYCYEQPGGVPEGVEVKDAAEILPADRIIRYRGRSVALFANFFRYELQRRGLGLWLDVDQYLVAPVDFDRPYIFGFEEPGVINNGVLRVPPDSPMLADLLAIFEEREVPFWLPPIERLKAARRLRRHGRTDLAKMPWGNAGPKALTALARKHGLTHWALDPEVLYPVHYKQARWIMDPSQRLEDVLTPRSVGLHLWNNIIARYKEQPAPPGSFLERLHEEGRLD
jgi:hypothetical protein